MFKSKFTINESAVHVSDNLTGKMNGVPAISTSVLENRHCQARRQCNGSICKECFAAATLNRYNRLEENLKDNTQILTEKILNYNDLPAFGNVRFTRFEAFGDLNNETQFINYVNICDKNDSITFALWTKNLFILKEYFNRTGKAGKPKNLIIVASSIMLNKPLLTAEQLKNDYWFIDKVFTVYSADYALDNNVVINCGARSCVACHQCYDTNNKTIFINEMLKKDLIKYVKKLSKMEG